MNKVFKIGAVAVAALLVGTLAFTGVQNQNQQNRIHTLTDTVNTVQNENSTLKKQLEQNGSAESVPTSSTSSAAVSSAAAPVSANHDVESAEALSTNLIQKFYTVSDKSNFEIGRAHV